MGRRWHALGTHLARGGDDVCDEDVDYDGGGDCGDCDGDDVDDDCGDGCGGDGDSNDGDRDHGKDGNDEHDEGGVDRQCDHACLFATNATKHHHVPVVVF